MSIGDLYGSSISLFPNPAHNKLFVEGLQNSNDRLSLSITDVGGRERIRRNLREEKEVIEISYLPGGFYFVSIYNGDTVVKNLKLVVDR